MCCFHRLIQRAGKGTHSLFELCINYLRITDSFNNNKWLQRIPGNMCFVAMQAHWDLPSISPSRLFSLYRILSDTLSLGFELSKKLLSTEKFWHFFRRKREEPNSILFSLIHSTWDKYLFSCLIPHREASNKYVPAPNYQFRTVSNVISMQLGSPTCFASSSPSTSFSWLSTSLLTTLALCPLSFVLIHRENGVSQAWNLVLHPQPPEWFVSTATNTFFTASLLSPPHAAFQMFPSFFHSFNLSLSIGFLLLNK